jgi:hypothetical protein
VFVDARGLQRLPAALNPVAGQVSGAGDRARGWRHGDNSQDQVAGGAILVCAIQPHVGPGMDFELTQGFGDSGVMGRCG